MEDVNDEAPVWSRSRFEGRVSLEAQPGHVVALVAARDPDVAQGPLTYAIHGRWGGRPFASGP